MDSKTSLFLLMLIIFQVPPMTPSECNRFFRHCLASWKRQLAPVQEEVAMRVFLQCPLPLYLQFLMREIVCWKSYTLALSWNGTLPPQDIKGTCACIDIMEEDTFNWTYSTPFLLFGQLLQTMHWTVLQITPIFSSLCFQEWLTACFLSLRMNKVVCLWAMHWGTSLLQSMALLRVNFWTYWLVMLT